MSDTVFLHWLIYSVGSIAILIEWRAYWLNCGQAFRRWSAAGALLWAVQYFLLGAWTAGLTIASTALRSLLSAQSENGSYKHWTVIWFAVLFVVLTAISWQGWISLLPAFAVINTTFALFYLGNRNMRIVLLASSAAWLASDIYWEAWSALLAESVAVVINIRTIRKLFVADKEGSGF